MAARGRPTPQIASDERPRFRDRIPAVDSGLNPYRKLHAELGPEAMTADEAWRWRGRWTERFGRAAPLVLEIGPGDGRFLVDLAGRSPEADHVAVEIRYKRVWACARRVAAAGLTNAVVCRYHAAFLDDLFEPASLSTIWVNHPDPWPKDRHEKNRLISRWFLQDVARLLVPGGRFRLKSDYRPNVDRAEQLLAADEDGTPADALPLAVAGRADDVTTGPAPWPDDVETGYQRKFRLKGLPVAAIELVRA
jgi:tRNA (guanine-N7-)-methyltransferase